MLPNKRYGRFPVRHFDPCTMPAQDGSLVLTIDAPLRFFSLRSRFEAR